MALLRKTKKLSLILNVNIVHTGSITQTAKNKNSTGPILRNSMDVNRLNAKKTERTFVKGQVGVPFWNAKFTQAMRRSL